MGFQFIQELEAEGLPYVRHPIVMAQLKRITDRLIAAVPPAFPRYSFDFAVIDDCVVNAFALPGGPIRIHRGLLRQMETEAELAGVLAHEMAHSARHHMAKIALKQVAFSQALGTLKGKRYRWLRRLGGGGLILLALSDMRGSEWEADFEAVRACFEAGYDPEGLASLLSRIGGEGPAGRLSELFMTHPPTSKRVARIRRAVEERADIEALCKVGWSLLKRGRLRRARDFFESALKREKGCKKAILGLVACLLRAGHLREARAEAKRLGIEKGAFSQLAKEYLPEPVRVASPPPEGSKAGLPPEGALKAVGEALKVVSKLSEHLIGHQTAIEVATWSARSDLAWLATYIEAVGLATAFREALFSVERAAEWVREAVREGEDIEEAVKALREATRLLERAHRAVRPNILSVVLSALSRGKVSGAQLIMLQTSFLAAQGWLRRCVREAERALVAAGRAKVRAVERNLGRRFLSLPPRGRGLVAEIASRRLGGERSTLIALLERGLPFGTACLILGASAEAGRDPITLAASLGESTSGVPLLDDLGVYAPDLAIVLEMLERDIEEATIWASNRP